MTDNERTVVVRSGRSPMTSSILSKARKEGAQHAVGQLIQLHNDEVEIAFERGRMEGEANNHPIRWWLLGLVVGLAVSASVWGIWS